jgi:hypothetical protein
LWSAEKTWETTLMVEAQSPFRGFVPEAALIVRIIPAPA